MNWLLARLKEPSSWRGIIWLLTFAGVTLEPAQAEAIITAGIALAGLLGVFTSDSQIKSNELQPIELKVQPDSIPNRRIADSCADLVSRRRVVSTAGDCGDRTDDRMQSPVSSEREHESFGFNDK